MGEHCHKSCIEFDSASVQHAGDLQGIFGCSDFQRCLQACVNLEAIDFVLFILF
ncbi:hypothetical protein Ahy_B09g096118 isoform D [Arachis hypogaea]|uniref:Uncharacterized protein n=1 Tax=Arachis hypogaea TaxID=3818 RepID=A0A444XIN4_ARAHY|nr:hypothetical protein Ahy_B09g096118 isoform D [Arachis hypogaea]